jgi:hypothetical protein
MLPGPLLDRIEDVSNGGNLLPSDNMSIGSHGP